MGEVTAFDLQEFLTLDLILSRLGIYTHELYHFLLIYDPRFMEWNEHTAMDVDRAQKRPSFKSDLPETNPATKSKNGPTTSRRF